MPSARGRKLSLDLTRAALGAAGDKGVFATSRTDNSSMHASLEKCGFLPAGVPYPSTRGEYKPQIFVRRAAGEASPKGPAQL